MSRAWYTICMLIDSHCHLIDSQYQNTVDEIIAHAKSRGVEKYITIGTSPASSADACACAEKYPDVFWTYGYHPNEYDGDKMQLEKDLAAAKPLFASKKLVGIGEIGLDYHFPPFDKTAQIYLLEHMLQIAQDQKLPVSFHVRDAFDDFWPIFDNFHLPKSVLHSFSDSEQNLAEGMRRDLCFGVNGLSTFAKIPHAPLDRILLETDAPYLTPKPFRGTINMPGYIKEIAEWASEYYKTSLDQVAKITTANVEHIFKV